VELLQPLQLCPQVRPRVDDRLHIAVSAVQLYQNTVVAYFYRCKKVERLLQTTADNLAQINLKGQCHEIFNFRFFFMNQFPPSSKVFQ
jgi:hypothetical protein